MKSDICYEKIHQTKIKGFVILDYLSLILEQLLVFMVKKTKRLDYEFFKLSPSTPYGHDSGIH